MSDSKAPNPATKVKSFRPRAGIVRKSKAERDAHAIEEAEKAAVRAAAAAQAAGRPTQSGKQAGAKKKKELPRDSRDSSQGTGRGVFGAGTSTRAGWKRTVNDTGRSEVLEGQEGLQPKDSVTLQGQVSEVTDNKIKGTTSTASTQNRASRVARDAATIESDNEPDERRRDIERIWISSGEEDEIEHESIEELDNGKDKSRAPSEGRRVKFGGGLRPVRAPRTSGEEHETEAQTPADNKSAKSSRTVVDDGEGHDDVAEFEDDHELYTGHLQAKADAPSSPELSRRGKPGRKLGSRTKDHKVPAETVEEKAERLRWLDDIDKLKGEFLLAPKVKKDTDMEQDDSDQRPDAKLFLFQFPPLIPFLVDESTSSAIGADGKAQRSDFEPVIKHEGDVPNVSQSTIVGEGSHSEAVLPKMQTEGMFTATEPLRLPPGRVGKLCVHKSGKVTMDWGGTDMEVRYGTEVNFLQDAILVETHPEPDEAMNKDSSAQTGTSYALGQVQKKMIVIPDWQKLYD